MPGTTDRPGAGPDDHSWSDSRGRPPGSQDELRRRLADLPPSHPSSPRYREGQSGQAKGERRPPERAAGPGEPEERRSGASEADGPGASGGVRSGNSRVNRAGPPAEGRYGPAAEAAGGRRGERRGTGDG